MNKIFDRMVKAFSDEAPRVFLRVTDVVPGDARVEIRPLRAESAPTVVMPDYVASLSVGGNEAFTFHVEFYLDYRKDIPRTMARYGGSLAWQYQRPVASVMMLLRRGPTPRRIPTIGRYVIGETATTHRYKVIRTWDVDPAPVLEAGEPKILPWAVLMNTSDEQVRQIAATLRSAGDEEAIARFLTLGSLRYDRKQLEAMLEVRRMGLAEAILEGSSLVKEATEKAAQEGLAQGRAEGRAEGRQQGREQGRVDEARRLLRVCLETRVPGLEAAPEIDQIADLEALESLMRRVLTTLDRDVIQRDLRAAAR